MYKLFKYEIKSLELDYDNLFEMGSIMFITEETIIRSIIKDNNISHSIENIYKTIVEREIYSFYDILNDRMKCFKDGLKKILKVERKQKLELLSKIIPNDIVHCVISKYL